MERQSTEVNYLVHNESLFPIDIHFKITANSFHSSPNNKHQKSTPQTRVLFWNLYQKERTKGKDFNNPTEMQTLEGALEDIFLDEQEDKNKREKRTRIGGEAMRFSTEIQGHDSKRVQKATGWIRHRRGEIIQDWARSWKEENSWCVCEQ